MSFRKIISSAPRKILFFSFGKILSSAVERIFPQLPKDYFLSFRRILSSASPKILFSLWKLTEDSPLASTSSLCYCTILLVHREKSSHNPRRFMLTFRRFLHPTPPPPPPGKLPTNTTGRLPFNLPLYSRSWGWTHPHHIGKFHLHTGKCSLFQP